MKKVYCLISNLLIGILLSIASCAQGKNEEFTIKGNFEISKDSIMVALVNMENPKKKRHNTPRYNCKMPQILLPKLNLCAK